MQLTPDEIAYLKTLCPKDEIVLEKTIRFKVGKPSPDRMTWDDAVKYATSFGEGWRLPNRDELYLMWQNRDKLGMEFDDYWSGEARNDSLAYYLHCRNGNQLLNYKDGNAAAFPVWSD